MAVKAQAIKELDLQARYQTATASNGEARRLIKGGGGRINDRPVESETQLVTSADLLAEGVIKLSAGKKRHALVRPV